MIIPVYIPSLKVFRQPVPNFRSKKINNSSGVASSEGHVLYLPLLTTTRPSFERNRVGQTDGREITNIYIYIYTEHITCIKYMTAKNNATYLGVCDIRRGTD